MQKLFKTPTIEITEFSSEKIMTTEPAADPTSAVDLGYAEISVFDILETKSAEASSVLKLNK
ncbi:MAG: hypothetical protein ACI4EA_02420 [Candidatus Ornithomonoglobus sp.]